jgi:hypothetical protein
MHYEIFPLMALNDLIERIPYCLVWKSFRENGQQRHEYCELDHAARKTSKMSILKESYILHELTVWA